MIDIYLLSVILFFLIIGILIYRNRKKVEIKYYILFMHRTKRFRDIIDSIARRFPRIWKIIFTIAVFVCLYYMVNGLFLILNIAYGVSSGLITQPALQFILPTPTSTGAAGPGYILIPFWFWMITIAIILIPHELSHGIIARVEKIKLKSVGLLLLAIFPGAFVEPDEKQIKKSKLLTKLRIFSAGSFANFVVALLVLLLTSYIFWPLTAKPGIELLNVTQDSPADIAGLKSGMVLTQINGKQIGSSYQEFLSGRGYFYDEIGISEPNQTIMIKADEKIYNVTLTELNNTAYMGIVYKPLFKVESFLKIVPLLTMIWLFSFGVGLFNILPIYPLDGGLMVEAIAERFSKKVAKKIAIGITYLMLLVILYTFIGPSL